MKIDIYHNIRWSRYKARVFSALHRLNQGGSDELRFFQVADTNGGRISLSGVDLSYHQYPHELLFSGSYDQIPMHKLIWTLFMRVLRSDADLVLIHGFDRPEHWAMLFGGMLSGKRCATFCDSTLHDRPQSHIKGVLKRFFFARCCGVFCYGQRAREYLMHYGVPATRIHQRYQAAALPDGYTSQAARAARQRLAASVDEPRFLYVGRLSPEKGLDTLLAAFAEVHRELPGARLVLAGGGPLAAVLKSQAGSSRLDDAIEFTGGLGQDALTGQYARATCLVLPSRSEPWGLVVNEALHYGCPVVVSERCGCVPELVQEGVSGYTFRCDDAVDLASRLLQLVRWRDAPDMIADRCLRVIAPYTPSQAAEQMLRSCREIMGDTRT